MIDLKYIKPSRTEEKVIKFYFKKFLDDNVIDTSGWSQPEMDFNLDIFRTSWMFSQQFIL